MNILIYGYNGWIGNQFANLLTKNNINFLKGTSRVDNTQDVFNELTKHKVTHVVSFIGRTHGKIDNKTYSTIDYLEQPGKLTDNIRDNLFSPVSLALICAQLNIHLTYIGTGCIFSYDDEHTQQIGFTEENKPNFFGSGYSIVKGFTDRLMHQFEQTVLNLRIRMPINNNPNPRDFITKITTYEKICSVPNSMTVLPDMLPVMLDMLTNNKTGTYNLTNPGVISHNEILQMYKEIVDPLFTWNNFTIEEQDKILVSKRSNNYLDTSKLEKEYPNIPTIHDSIRNCLKQYTPIPKYRLLVTGGCGFIGSNFVNHIIKTRPDMYIVNLDVMYYSANLNNIENYVLSSGRYKFIEGNICDSNLVRHILKSNTITHIIHFAAQSHVQNSFKDVTKFVNDNILGTQKLLECSREYLEETKKLIKFIHVSTDEVYGESVNNDKNTEKTILHPTNPYSASKAGAEMFVHSYHKSYNIPIIITRSNNVYGPNQHNEKVIPCFINKLKNNQKITIQGDGSVLRSFIHVFDLVRAFECIIDKGKIGEIYNIGSDDEYSIMNVAEIMVKYFFNDKNKKVEDYIEFIEDRPFNDRRYHICSKKIKSLGWTQQVNFEDELRKLVMTSTSTNTNTNTDIAPNTVNDKESVFVLVSDKKYEQKMEKTICELRQNGKWEGDIVVVTIGYKISEEIKNKYNIIEKIFPQIDKRNLIQKIGKGFQNSDKRELNKLTQWEKFQVFDTYFMKWKRVVYLDAGISVCDSVKYLLELDYKGKFLCGSDIGMYRKKKIFIDQIDHNNKDIVKKILDEFGDILESHYFLNCMWVYDTDILNIFNKQELIDTMNKYPICRTNEMGIMNLIINFKHKLWSDFPSKVHTGKFLFDWCEFNNPGTTWKDYCFIKYRST